VSARQPSRAVVIGALLLVQLFFGLHYVIIKRWSFDHGLDALTWAPIRAVFAAVLLCITARAFRCPFPRDPKLLKHLAGAAVLGIVINQICFVAGLARTTAGYSSLINITIPVSALVVAWLLRQERFDPLRGLGVCIAGSGLAIMVVGGPGLKAEWQLGNFLTAINAVSYGSYLVVSRNAFRQMHPYAGTAVLFVFGAAGIVASMCIAWAVGWWAPQTDFSALPAQAWWGMLYALGPATIGAYALNAFALRWADSSVVGFFILMQPLIATSYEAAAGHSELTGHFALAAALVGTGVVVVLRGPKRALDTAEPLPASAPVPVE
jgi:drug/metabolite transporter (DMT)-like permease